MRRFVVAALLALALVAGVVGYALGSIPSSDGFIHACYANQPQQYKTWYALDKDAGNCPAGTTEVKLVGTAGP